MKFPCDVRIIVFGYGIETVMNSGIAPGETFWLTTLPLTTNVSPTRKSSLLAHSVDANSCFIFCMTTSQVSNTNLSGSGADSSSSGATISNSTVALIIPP